jgi:copper chaperone CopZ
MKTSLINSMALVFGVLLLAAGGPWLARELRSLPRPHALAARSGERIVTLDVAGMTCSGCASKVREELVAVPGVSTAEVRLGQRRAFVVCDRSLADSVLTGAVGRAGPGFVGYVAK